MMHRSVLSGLTDKKKTPIPLKMVMYKDRTEMREKAASVQRKKPGELLLKGTLKI